MSLSRLQPRWTLAGVMATLGLSLLTAGTARAEYPNVLRLPLSPKGYQIVLAQQQFWQRAETMAYQAPPPVLETYAEPRYVAIIGPDGRVRTFQIEGPITVVRPAPTEIHFGANNSSVSVVQQPAMHFGANTSYVPPAEPRIHFGANH